MQRTGWVMLGCLFTAAFAAQAGVARSTADEDKALEQLRALSVHAYATAHEVEQARSGLVPPDAAVDLHVHALRDSVDAIRAGARVSSEETGTPLARKLRAVSLLVGNIERMRNAAASGAQPKPLPRHLSPGQRATFAKPDARHGGTCEGAIGLAVGTELTGPLAANAQVWLRVADAGPDAIGVDTSSTPMDTEIAVFDQCPQQGQIPTAVTDDTYGLAAAVLLHPTEKHAPHWLRVRNLGDRGEISIAAAASGSIDGLVTRAANGEVLSADIYVFDHLGNYVAGGYNGSNGYVVPLAPGSYYVVALANGYVSEVWPNIECAIPDNTQSCAFGAAQAVSVGAGVTDGIDFALGTGARMIGRVRDASSGVAIYGAAVQVWSIQGTPLYYSWSDEAGRYAVTTLPGGSYRVSVNASTYRPQVFNGIDCPESSSDPCDISQGTPVALASGGVGSADFNLHPLHFATVTVNFAAGDNTSVFAQVYIYNSAGGLIGFQSMLPGQPTAMGPLPSGTYYFEADAQSHVSQMYDHIDCSGNCQIADATPVTVSPGSSVPAIRFDLRKLATVAGHITDSGTGAALPDTTITLWPTTGNGSYLSTYASTDGDYAVDGVPPGTYWVIVGSYDHRDTAYVNAPCSERSGSGISECQIGAAQTITVADADVGGIDVALPLNGSIEGTLHYNGIEQLQRPINYSSVKVYDAVGTDLSVSPAYLDGGHYRVMDLPAGTYYAGTAGYEYFSQVYDGIDCPVVNVFCNPIGGTPIALAQGEVRSGIDFSVFGSRRIVGRATDSITGAGVAGVVIDSWDPQSGVHCADAATDVDGYYVIEFENTCAGTTRKLSTDAGPAYIDEVYDDIACPAGSAYAGNCSLAAGAILTFPDVQPGVTQADFVLTAHDPDLIFTDGFDLATRRRAH